MHTQENEGSLFDFPHFIMVAWWVTQTFPESLYFLLFLLNWPHNLSHLFSFSCRIRQASAQPRREYQPKPRMSLEFPTGDSTQPNGGLSHTGTPKPSGKELRRQILLHRPWHMHWHSSRNFRNNPIWLHRKYAVIDFLWSGLSGRNCVKGILLSFFIYLFFPSF